MNIMKPNSLKYLLLFLLAAPLTSCNEELDWFEEPDNTVKNPYVEIVDTAEQPVEEVSAVYQGEYITLRVNSNTAWTATVNEEAKLWCTVNPPSNRGNSRMMIRVMGHTTIRPREATITVACSDKISRTITIAQEGTPLLSMNSTVMAMVRSTQQLTVNAPEGEDWIAEITEGGEWFYLSETEGTGPSTVSIGCSTNGTGAERPATVIFKTGMDETGEYTISDKLTVTQKSAMDEFVVRVEDADTLSLKWKKLLGATSYRVIALEADGSTPVGEVTLQEQDTAYLFLPASSDGISNSTKLLDIYVKALTAEEAYDTQSETIRLHPMFDNESGDGSDAASPFRISSPRHLGNVRYMLSGYFVQTADIDLAGRDDDQLETNGNFTPIADFAGTYDGGGHSISGLRIINSATLGAQTVGLFSQTAIGTEAKQVSLQNIRIVSPYVERASTEVGGCGALLGLLNQYGSVTGCVVSGGEVRNAGARVGSLLGDAESYTYIARCGNEGCSVFGSNNNTGGILGQATNGIETVLEYCYNTGTVTGANWAGGICGTLAVGMTIRYSYNLGTVTGNKECGGIYGRGLSSAKASSYVTGCWNAGSVTTSGASAGGIGGTLSNPQVYIANCYNTGAAKATNQAGGIIAYIIPKAASPRMIVNCYNVGAITNGAGLIGQSAQTQNYDTVIEECFYLNTTAQTGAPVTITTGFEAKDDAAMKDFSTFSAWPEEEWQAGDAGYPYPQLKKNPYVQPESGEPAQ